MPAIATHRIAIQYVSDLGVTYQVTGDKAEATQATQGGVAAAGTEPQLPSELKMRHAAFHTTGLTPNITREVVLYTPAAAAALTPASTVSLQVNNLATTFTWSQVYTGEKNRKRRVTHQLT